MAKSVMLASMLIVGGTDLSAYCSRIEVSLEAESKDTTTFGSGGWHEELSGIKSGSIAVTFKQDVAAAALDSILFPWFGTVQTFEVRMANGARSTSNPAYLGSLNLRQYNPIAGSVGDTAETGGLTWPTTGAVTRATA
jgi:predicted secreted protein